MSDAGVRFRAAGGRDSKAQQAALLGSGAAVALGLAIQTGSSDHVRSDKGGERALGDQQGPEDATHLRYDMPRIAALPPDRVVKLRGAGARAR